MRPPSGSALCYAEAPLGPDVLAVMGGAIALSFLLPLVAYALLRVTTKLGKLDAAATAAHYGSISIVTCVAATQAVSLAGLDSSGYLVAAAALMETPAIMTALLLVSRERVRDEDQPGGGKRELFREVALNASVSPYRRRCDSRCLRPGPTFTSPGPLG